MRSRFQEHAIRSLFRFFRDQGGSAPSIISLVAVITLLLTSVGIHQASAAVACASSDQVVTVQVGDTLGGIAGRYHMTWAQLQTYNHLSNPNLIFPWQSVCIPHAIYSKVATASPKVGVTNPFAYGQCTWYADQRYYQMHHVYVPWSHNADAWQWTARAYQYHWHVSTTPSWGAIVDLQAGVQGAYEGGHVAVVEQILPNGHVIASNINWGVEYWKVTNVQFTPGQGVTFLSL